MENSEEQNLIEYKIVDVKKCMKTLASLESAKINEAGLIEETIEEQIGEKIYSAAATVLKWLRGESVPETNSIKLLMKEYGLSPEELGAKEIDVKEEKEMEKKLKEIFSKRLKELIAQKAVLRKELASAIGVSSSRVTDWCKGKSFPSKEAIQKIANYFGVSKSYLLGDTDIPNANDEVIYNRFGINSNSSNVLQQEKNIPRYGNNTNKFIKEKFGFEYTDINNFIIQDKELKDIFYLEACNVLRYYTSDIYKSEFEELFNEIEVNLDEEELGIDKNLLFGTITMPTPYRKTIKTIAKTVLQIKIGRMFDEFIDNIMNNKNIDEFTNYEIRMREQELIEQKEKIDEELKQLEQTKNNKKKKSN